MNYWSLVIQKKETSKKWHKYYTEKHSKIIYVHFT